MKKLVLLTLLSALALPAAADTYTNNWNFRLQVSDQVQDAMKFLKRSMEVTNAALTNVTLKDFATNYVTVVVLPDVADAIRQRRNKLIQLIQLADDNVLKAIEAATQ